MQRASRLTALGVLGCILLSLAVTARIPSAGGRTFASSGISVAVPSMHDSRVGQTATLLGDGRVLVAGGTDIEGKVLRSAEVFNPRTHRWSSTAPMADPRAGHVAALLVDGTVLVAGGGLADYDPAKSEQRSPSYASAELYVPSANTWRATGSMPFRLLTGSAVVLLSHDVLVAGFNDHGEPESALYQVRRHRWRNVPAPPLQENTARLLPDGTVLAIGTAVITGTAETATYDPASGRWSRASKLPLNAAAGLAAVTSLLSGDVLMVGGLGVRDQFLSSVVLYDRVTRRWITKHALPAPLLPNAAVRMHSGEVLVLGYGTHFAGLSRTVLLYSPSKDRWSVCGALLAARGAMTATVLLDGSVLVAGGEATVQPAGPTAAAELVDPSRCQRH